MDADFRNYFTATYKDSIGLGQIILVGHQVCQIAFLLEYGLDLVEGLLVFRGDAMEVVAAGHRQQREALAAGDAL